MTHVFLTPASVRKIHDLLVVEYGIEPHSYPDKESVFESAIGAPQFWSRFRPEADLFDLAALYAYRLAKAHYFVDGNKRTGYISAFTFLSRNGVQRRDAGTKIAETLVRAVADATTDEDEKLAPLADLLRRDLKRKENG